MKLEKREIDFCHEVLKGCDPAIAAVNAGYDQNTASTIAKQNLLDPKIRKYIDQCRLEALESIFQALDDILEEFKKEILRADISSARRHSVQTAYDAFFKLKKNPEDTKALLKMLKINVVDEKIDLSKMIWVMEKPEKKVWN